MTHYKKLAKLLRTREEVIVQIAKKMGAISGRKKVVEKIVEENENKVRESLIKLGFGRKKNVFKLEAEEVYQALLKKAEVGDAYLTDRFFKPDFSSLAGCRSLINAAKELAGDLHGFYLKAEKAKDLMRQNPPLKIMESLGYSDVEKMLAEEDIYELFAALRFVEEGKWLNKVFFKAYDNLKAEDFEKRDIKVMSLPERWAGIGREFLGKKLHHMSHLKELGLVFIIPVEKQAKGGILYLLFMSLHYIFEVDWHSRLFEKYSQEKDFSKKMINALKVEVSGDPLPDDQNISWRIIPSYLAKHDKNDPRLAEPHISPEAWHYTRAGRALTMFNQRFEDSGFEFWDGLDTAGEFFKNKEGKKELISFDLYDIGISLLRQEKFISKYLYHQQEALWNQLFIEYLGEGELDRIMMEHLDQGFVTL